MAEAQNLKDVFRGVMDGAKKNRPRAGRKQKELIKEALLEEAQKRINQAVGNHRSEEPPFGQYCMPEHLDALADDGDASRRLQMLKAVEEEVRLVAEREGIDFMYTPGGRGLSPSGEFLVPLAILSMASGLGSGVGQVAAKHFEFSEKLGFTAGFTVPVLLLLGAYALLVKGPEKQDVLRNRVSDAEGFVKRLITQEQKDSYLARKDDLAWVLKAEVVEGEFKNLEVLKDRADYEARVKSVDEILKRAFETVDSEEGNPELLKRHLEILTHNAESALSSCVFEVEKEFLITVAKDIEDAVGVDVLKEEVINPLGYQGDLNSRKSTIKGFDKRYEDRIAVLDAQTGRSQRDEGCIKNSCRFHVLDLLAKALMLVEKDFKEQCDRRGYDRVQSQFSPLVHF